MPFFSSCLCPSHYSGPSLPSSTSSSLPTGPENQLGFVLLQAMVHHANSSCVRNAFWLQITEKLTPALSIIISVVYLRCPEMVENRIGFLLNVKDSKTLSVVGPHPKPCIL
uniref:Putative protein RIG n=1 Tax=Homo sapiens TaxID=9606 RepID=RIG_HUMAN|nr:RecName: Full=Putative protein RIG; AltName: Full=Protein regulated in glioma [Homo sapiens]AAC35996.1 RIG [Homo sapiens]